MSNNEVRRNNLDIRNSLFIILHSCLIPACPGLVSAFCYDYTGDNAELMNLNPVCSQRSRDFKNDERGIRR